MGASSLAAAVAVATASAQEGAGEVQGTGRQAGSRRLPRPPTGGRHDGSAGPCGGGCRMSMVQSVSLQRLLGGHGEPNYSGQQQRMQGSPASLHPPLPPSTLRFNYPPLLTFPGMQHLHKKHDNVM